MFGKGERVAVSWLVVALALHVSPSEVALVVYIHTFSRLRQHICARAYHLLFLCPWVLVVRVFCGGGGPHTLDILWPKPHGTGGGPPHHHPLPHPARGRALHHVRGTAPHNSPMHPLQPPVRATMPRRSAATPAHPYLQGRHIPRHYTRGPTPLPPARSGLQPRHTATPCRAPGGGTIPLPEAPPPLPIRRTPAR